MSGVELTAYQDCLERCSCSTVQGRQPLFSPTSGHSRTSSENGKPNYLNYGGGLHSVAFILCNSI